MGETAMHIGVIGAGAWGTALAIAMTGAGHRVTLWAREAELARDMAERRENALYLPGIPLPDAITPTNERGDLAADIVLLVAPAQATRQVMTDFARHLAPATPLIICAKGIERDSGKFLTEVVRETADHARPYVLSGPSFAREVAMGKPAAVTLAGDDIAPTRALARRLAHPALRIYSSDDPLGAQIGGAMKNVLAIACGIVAGRGFGESARAALLTRAFAELHRFGIALGAKPETLNGLSGLGDLLLTATSEQSRNYSLGVALGQGRALADILGERSAVTEGVHSAQIAMRLAERHGIDMPICAAVAAVVGGVASVDEQIARLLNRPLKDETG